MAIFHGTKHDDDLTGTTGDDTFDLFKGGNDTVSGGDGDDLFQIGASLNAGDRLDGGADRDTVLLHGDYSAGVTFDDLTIQNIEVLRLGKGFDYKLTLADGNVAARDTLTVNASKLGAGNSLIFDGSAESDGHFAVYGGAGGDALTGGAKADVFHLETGGNDTAHGGGGNDTFYLGGAFTASEIIDGGAGNDTLELNGDYTGGASLVFGAATMTGIETLKLDAGHFYSMATNDGNVAAGQTLTVDFSAMTGNGVNINGGAEQDGNFHFIAGATGAMALAGGAGNDIFDLTHAGGSVVDLNGRAGDDTFLFDAGFNDINISSFSGGDGNDTIEFNGDYSSLLIGAVIDSIETFRFDAGHSYGNVTIAENNTVPVTVDASQVGTLFTLSFTQSTAFIVDVGSGGMHATPMGNNTHDDTFIVTSKAALSASTLDAGNGQDTLELNGDFSSTLVLGATTVVNFEAITLDAGHGYSLVGNDAAVASGATMTVDGSALTGGNTLSFVGSSESDGHFAFISGAGADDLEGGALSDTFDLTRTHTAVAAGNGGNDSFTVAASAILDGGFIDGGADSDTLILNGDFHLLATIKSANVQNIEGLTLLGAANTYSLALKSGIEGTGTFSVDASAAAKLTLDLGSATASAYDVTGSGGDDVVRFAGNFSASDTIDGGAGNDTLVLNAGTFATLAASSFTGMETLQLFGDGNYSLTLADGNIAAGETLVVDAGQAHDGVLLSASHETDGTVHFIAGKISGDNFIGGAGNDIFDMTLGNAAENQWGTGGGGNDVFDFADRWGGSSKAIGGTGSDTLKLDGDYSGGITFVAPERGSGLYGMENITVAAGHSYNLTTSLGNFDGGAAVTIDASALGAANALTFNGSAETSAHFVILCGAGADHIVGGNKGDTITGGGGADVFAYTGAAQSTSTAHDTIADFAAGTDKIDTTVTVTSFFATAIDHAVNAASFDSDLNSAGDDALPGHQAWIVHASGGDLIGHDFLVVDVNGNAQYNAGTDYVIDITGHAGTVTAGDFI